MPAERYMVKLFSKDGYPQTVNYYWRYQRTYHRMVDALWFIKEALYGKYSQSSVWHAHVVGDTTGTLYGSHTKGRGGQSHFRGEDYTYTIDRHGVHATRTYVE